jgi:hypothetical protein
VDNIQRILDISNVGLAAFSELSYFATDSQVSQNVRFGLEPPPPRSLASVLAWGTPVWSGFNRLMKDSNCGLS